MNRVLRIVALCVISVIAAATVSAQGMRDMRINEVLINNTDSYMDDYGHRNTWIELHNMGYSQVNLAGSFLKVISGGDTISYKIPKNDPRTWVAPQGYVVFYADGTGSKGTFYTNFTLTGKGTIALYDASGRGKPVSSISFDEQLHPENVSFGWFTTEQGGDARWMALPQTTPNSTNETIEFKAKGEVFRELDPYGVVMAITAMLVVFFALILLYQVFKAVGRKMISRAVKKENGAIELESAIEGKKMPLVQASDEEIPSEVLAAIGAAIRRYEKELSDEEAIVLTINRVARTYSPWSSKLYGMTNQLKK